LVRRYEYRVFELEHIYDDPNNPVEIEVWEAWFVRGVGIVKVQRTTKASIKAASLVSYNIEQ
jgi:hypothetical protein